MNCAFLVVTYNSLKDLPALLASLSGTIREGDEILFWDNDSTDKTLDFLRRQNDQRLKVFSDGKNLGFGSAMNRLARQSSASILVLVNPDCRWKAWEFHGWLEKRLNPSLGALAPAIHYPNGKIQPNRGGDSSLTTFVLQFLRAGALVRTLGLAKILTHAKTWPLPRSVQGFLANFGNSAAVTSCDWVSGAFCAIPRTAFDAVGGFDERYFMYSEDEDICRRLRQQGLNIIFDPGFAVVHAVENSQTSEGFSRARLERYRSQILFLEKWYGAKAGRRLKCFWKIAFPAKVAGLFLVGHWSQARIESQYMKCLLQD